MKNWQESRRDGRSTQLRVVERQLPNNVRAEEIVLGTLLTQPEKLEEVIDVLRPSDFYAVRHKILYEIMVDYYRHHGEYADFLVLSQLLESSVDLEPSDIARLIHLANELWSLDLAQDARLILGPSIQRQIIFASQQLVGIGYDITDPGKARAAVEKMLYDLSTATAPAGGFDSLADILHECMNDLETACNMRGQLLGVPSGFLDLDLMTNGFQRTDLIIAAGRPGFGKSSLGMGIGYNAAKRGKVVAVFSLEMGKKQLGNRLLSHVSRISANRLRAGWVDKDELEKVVQAQDELSELPIYIDDTAGTPISSIRSKLRRLRAKIHRNIDLVVVDYLQLMEDEDDSPAKRENRNQEISKISRGLKLIAKEFNVPVLALAQLSRAVESRQNKIPQLSDLRESGSLEQDADIVLFIYRDEMYNPKSERKNTADIIVAKHRNGPVGVVNLAFNSALTRFDNLAGSNYEPTVEITEEIEED